MTVTKRKTPYRRTRGEIAQKLAEVEHRIAEGATIEKVAKDIGVSEATVYYWRREAKKAKAVEKKAAAMKSLAQPQSHAGLILHDGQLFSSNIRPVPEGDTVSAMDYNRLLEENLFLRGIIGHAVIEKFVREGVVEQRETRSSGQLHLNS